MSEEESVDLTPGVVWTDAQLAVVRDLTVRCFKAEAAVERVEGVAKVWDGIADMWRDSAEHPAAAPRAREMARGEEFDFRERARVLRAALDGTP